MKKSSLTISILFATMLLAACNTTETSIPNDTTNETNTTEETTDITNSAKVDQKDEEQLEENTEQSINDKTEVTVSSPKTNNTAETQAIKTIEYTFNDQAYTAQTETVTSEQLGYSIKLAEGFTLTSEEPGRDMIFYTADSNYSMRVEYYLQADHSYDTLLKNVENLMIASTNNNFETFNIEQSAFDIHKGTQFISVDEASGLQTIGAVFEKNEYIIVVTIFDGPENTLKDAFLQMAYSIE